MSSGGAPQHCVACGLPPRGSYLLRNGARLLRCPRCRLGWWDWPAMDAAGFYDQDYFQSGAVARGYDDYASLEPGLRRSARGRLRRIERNAAGRARLLDVGCGTGIFLDEARRAGWDVCGLEVSAYAAAQARERGLTVNCAPGEELDVQPESFDCVTMWDALEHVRDPAGVLLRAARALRPGGVLALSTGDITSLCAWLSGRRWHLFNLPEHLFFFSPECLRKLLQRAGCRIADSTREVNWVPVAYLSERLRKSLGLHAVHRAATRADWVVPATLFDVLGVYAVRTAARLNEGETARGTQAPRD